MGLIYHAALENRLIICFMDSRPWNASLPVFCRLVDVSKIKSTIFTNRRIATALAETVTSLKCVQCHPARSSTMSAEWRLGGGKLRVEWALTPRGHGLPWDWYAKAMAYTIQWANLYFSPFLLKSVADKELLRAAEAPGAVHVFAIWSHGTQQRQGWICLLQGQCLQVHQLIMKRRGGNLGHVSKPMF